jgi:hypothetical protein
MTSRIIIIWLLAALLIPAAAWGWPEGKCRSDNDCRPPYVCVRQADDPYGVKIGICVLPYSPPARGSQYPEIRDRQDTDDRGSQYPKPKSPFERREK